MDLLTADPQQKRPDIDIVHIQRIVRTTIVTDLQTTMRRLTESIVPNRLITNFYGITGIGKTQLVEQLFDQYKIEYPVVLLNFDLIDCGLQGAQVYSWNTLADLFQANIRALNDLPERIAITTGESRPNAAFSIGCRFSGLELATERPLLLLLDAIDDLSYWKWVQEHLIKPLIAQQQTLVVCASRAPLFWHFWELREQCDFREVPAFTVEETQQFLRIFDQELFTKTLHDITLGYPLGLHQAIHLLGDNNADILTSTPAFILDELAPVTQEVTRYTGLLRLVEVPVMQKILTLILPSWANAPSNQVQQRLFGVLSELRAAGYLETLRKSQPLRFLPMVRRVVETTLRATELETYQRICTLLTTLYARHIVEKPVTEEYAFNEWLYFSTVQYDLAPSSTTLAAWTEQAGALIARARLAGPHLIQLLYHDVELMRRLHTVGVFPILRRLLAEHLGDDTTVSPLLNDTIIIPNLRDYRKMMLQRLSERLPLYKLPPRIGEQFAGFLQHIADLDQDFDTRVLLQKFHETQPGPINEAMALLNSWNFFTYNRTKRTYQLHPLIRHLLIDTMQDSTILNHSPAD